MEIFKPNFNPQFHWQMDKKKIARKKVLIFGLILVLILSVFFIFKRYYFVSGRSIDLEELIPDQNKAVLKISLLNLINNQEDSSILNSLFYNGLGLRDILEEEKKQNFFINNIDQDIYWLEKDKESQLILFKIKDIDLLKDVWKSIVNDSNHIEYNKRNIYEYSKEEKNNIFLPNDRVYISYLNDYIFSISNDLEFSKMIVDQYKEASKIDYLGSIKDELSNYFIEQNALVLAVNNYNDLENSFSWIKNLSFLNKENKNSFQISLKIKSKKVELVFDDYSYNRKIDLSPFDENLLDDMVLYYSNLGVDVMEEEKLVFDENLNFFLKNNIENIYNLDLREKLRSINHPYYFLGYKENNFLIISRQEEMKEVYKKILAHLNPQTRNMVLPDGSSTVEYYADYNKIDLKQEDNNGLLWYYADLLGNIGFYLVQYDDWYILTNFKEKIVELSKNKEEFYNILDLSNKKGFKEFLVLNLYKIADKNVFPWLKLFPKTYQRLNFVNLAENGSNKVFFGLIH